MDRPLTVRRRTHPWLVQVADRAVTLGQSLGLPLGNLDPDVLLADAARIAGHSDFGDHGFEEGMRQVISNVDALGFTPISRVVMRGMYGKALQNRLGLQARLKAHPEIRDVLVERPIFVLGFPRTGTTLLQNLLCQHPDRRALPFWELITPLPRSEHRGLDRAVRRLIAWQILRAAHIVAPEQNEVHDVRVDTYEECWYVFCNMFRVLNWDIQTGLQSYGQWLFETDMRPAYQEYRTWLQVMLHHRPARQLVLKCPEHLWFTDALLDVFPDACIIWTHRDPVASVASYCSMMALTRRFIYGRFEPEEMGPYIAERFWQGVSRAMEVRDRPGRSANFFDADFTELTADPGRVLSAAAEHFGLEGLDPQRIAAWQQGDREDKQGRHVYSPEAFGVDRDAVHARFAPYIERFRIPVKGAR